MGNILTFIDPIAKLLGNWSSEINVYSIILRIALAVIFGALIGWERSNKRHFAGLRTFILITLTGCLAMILDLSIGIGLFFLSAATIIGSVTISGNSILFSSKNQIRGLTTSAGLWICDIFGLLIGMGYYLISIILLLILICILSILPSLEFFLKEKSNHFEIHLELKDRSNLQDFIFTLRKLNLRIDDMELNNSYIGSGLSVYTISLTDKEKDKRKHKDLINALSTLEYVSYIEEIN